MLKARGHCLGIPRNAYRTLVKWTNGICKKRIAFRLKEKSQSGRAEIQPPTAVDTVAGKYSVLLYKITFIIFGNIHT
jgi:hypothetical protein